MFLHYCQLKPQGPSSLAAIRFTSPIRVQTIRIFPTGAIPFAKDPQVIAQVLCCTEPNAFFLDVFYNAHPLSPSDSKEKQRASNALVPTSIAYTGGQVDLAVGMTQYATRLMIVKGNFDCLSIAIYGDIVTDIPPPPHTYEPKPLPSNEPLILSRAVDPSNSSDPTLLAKNLLSLLPDPPPLPLLIRRMFCLKASNEEWDLPEFPHIYADLDAEMLDFSLEKAVDCTTRPVPDDISYESLEAFAKRIANSIGPKSRDQSYQMANILCNAASQHPDMARVLLQCVDLGSIFDAHNMDEMAVLRLLDASTNIDIARHLNCEWFLDVLRTAQCSSKVDKHTQQAVRRLGSRLQGWKIFEDALSNTQGDFYQSARMLKDVGTEEASFGIWLESMITHNDVIAKLAENPVLPFPQSHPSPLLRSSIVSVSHDEFITFVRAYIGASSVLAVWAWTDSIGNDLCRERTLAVLRLWQDVDGYHEIVNHLLLLPQLTRRLEWIIADSNPPRKSGILAEQVLADVAHDPHAVLMEDFTKAILSLRQPLSFITENDRLSMRKVALVAEDGLPAAIEELMFSSDHPLSLRRLRTLRVSLAIVKQELETEKGEWRLLQVVWDEQSHGLGVRLVDIIAGVSDDLNAHFRLTPPPVMNQALVDQLFRTADDILRLLARLTPTYPLTTRSTRALTTAVADIFTCTDAADMLYSQSSSACISAQGTRQTCLELVRDLSNADSWVEPEKLGAEVILRTLFEHGAGSDGRDPAYHLLQIICLIDHLLPISGSDPQDVQPSHWITNVIPSLLTELSSFVHILDTENKVHFVKRLVNLDNGVIGIGDWLFLEELKQLSQVLRSLENGIADEDRRSVARYHVSLSLRFIRELVMATSSASTWCITCISTVPDVACTLKECLMSLLDGHFTSTQFTELVQVLSEHATSFDLDLQFAIALTLLRQTQNDHDPSASHIAPVLAILTRIPDSHIDIGFVRMEMGRMFSSFSDSETIERDTATSLLGILLWFDEHVKANLSGITPVRFSALCDRTLQVLPASEAEALKNLRSSIVADEDEVLDPPTVYLPDSLAFTLQDIEDLLAPPTPSTPKGKHTPDILGLVVVSPPNALLRSPAATGLTKTYVNNDFRQLRQIPSARQNTSRLPSMHVDDFELSSSPMLPLAQVPMMPDLF